MTTQTLQTARTTTAPRARMPAPNRTESVAERIHREAMALIEAETRARDKKVHRLRTLRLEREASEAARNAAEAAKLESAKTPRAKPAAARAKPAVKAPAAALAD